jgi:hypothetical protein
VLVVRGDVDRERVTPPARGLLEKKTRGGALSFA